ncbi:Phenazine biosynthesis-like protein [Penicillium alfredii]|uniref:Phenazine biosynthesis-like protein n=1 Tax=Penicillium alfredii TaxID=1506179 RepID=A0A9W9K8S0_9EURO|nr:Phenazine biosynthesis-like protein [Penicillium alfredii]KAJ5096212.1 Phenazine biosynthesis-like protein [Penicillium alfredii]
MAQLSFVTLDVFTSQPYSGNPLAVVFLPEDSDSLSQSQKQTIAREFNLSETIFVHPAREQSKRTIDIFTTDCELPFAGHPTIGAASWFLCHSTDAADASGVTTLATKSGDIPISIQDSISKAVSAQIAHNTRIHAARFGLKDLLRLHPTLAPFFPQPDVSFPVFSIVNGMSQVFIELPTLAALAAVTPATGGELVSSTNGNYLDEGWRSGLVSVYFFVREVDDDVTDQKIIRTRMMLGTLEDPATGSSACGLAAYLTLTEGQAGQPHLYHVVQGVEMGRRSDIGVGVALDPDMKIKQMLLTGTAVRVSEGRVLVPDV